MRSPLYLIPAFLFGISFTLLFVGAATGKSSECLVFCEPMAPETAVAIAQGASVVMGYLPLLGGLFLGAAVTPLIVRFAFRWLTRYADSKPLS